MTLVEFLTARLDEDEQMKWLSKPGSEWHVAEQADCECCDVIRDAADSLVCTPDDRYSDHIARHDPARVLRDVEAKRRIVDEHTTTGTNERGETSTVAWCETCRGVNWPCGTLRLLALPYADHPDYDPKWSV